MEEKKTKQTSDIYLASAFMALGAGLEDVDRSDPRHMVFHFASDELDFEDVEKRWVNKTLMINAVDFKVAIQQMKSVIYAY